MKRIILLLLFTAAVLHAQTKSIFVVNIEDEIDLGLAPFIERAVEQAEDEGAEAILFRINTFGGRVDAATQIKDAILNSDVPTIAYVDKRAISAGALITLACRKVAMAPGSSIGATTVVDQAGQKGSEKMQSYMRSEMRATAERNGRRTDIAEAMVDEKVVVPGLVDSTQLVTLTAAEAAKFSITDTITLSIDETLAAFGYEDYELVPIEINWAEEVVRFLSNPVISSLLIMIGMVGMFTEVKTPGWGLPGTMGAVALALFFGSSMILDLASILEIALFVVGVVLLLVEVFVIPGFGVAGILGILFMVASLFLSLINMEGFFDFDILQTAIIQLAITLLASTALFALIYRYLPKSSAFKAFVLAEATSTKEGYIGNPDQHALVGRVGKAFTSLRPSGTAVISGKKYDVVTDGQYIEKDELIKVIAVVGVRVVVDKDTSGESETENG